MSFITDYLADIAAPVLLSVALVINCVLWSQHEAQQAEQITHDNYMGRCYDCGKIGGGPGVCDPDACEAAGEWIDEHGQAAWDARRAYHEAGHVAP